MTPRGWVGNIPVVRAAFAIANRLLRCTPAAQPPHGYGGKDQASHPADLAPRLDRDRALGDGRFWRVPSWSIGIGDGYGQEEDFQLPLGDEVGSRRLGVVRVNLLDRAIPTKAGVVPVVAIPAHVRLWATLND